MNPYVEGYVSMDVSEYIANCQAVIRRLHDGWLMDSKTFRWYKIGRPTEEATPGEREAYADATIA